MPQRCDCGNEEFAVTLHSEIRDVHRLAADVDYFFRARMLFARCTQKSETSTGLQPTLTISFVRGCFRTLSPRNIANNLKKI